MSLLIHSQPLLVLPELAVKIGLNEAIILQQIHYWQSRSANFRDGRAWVYNSVEDWKKQFPFWSAKTISRALNGLRKQDLVFTGQYNQQSRDQTLWYSVNYDHNALKPSNGPLGQNDPMEQDNMSMPLGQNDPMHYPKMGEPLPETTTETTTENKQSVASDDATAVFEHWRSVMGKSKRTVLDNNRKRLIQKALSSYSLDDVKAAITGCSLSPHHMGRNDRNTVYNGLDLILRNAEKIEQFIGYSENPPANIHSLGRQRQSSNAPAPSSDDCGGKVYIPTPANGVAHDSLRT